VELLLRFRSLQWASQSLFKVDFMQELVSIVADRELANTWEYDLCHFLLLLYNHLLVENVQWLEILEKRNNEFIIGVGLEVFGAVK